MLKSGGMILLGAVGSAYLAGAFDTYPRTVDGTPQAVMASVVDLDIREQPGAPGSTAESAGGVKPTFRTVRGTDKIEWIAMSGGETAMTLTASFEPVGADRTKIRAWVTRGDAPDERVSPAFRSSGLTLGLFHAALDSEIAEMTAPVWGPHCDDKRDELMAGLAGEGLAMAEADDITESVVAVGGAAAGLARVRRELIAAGCNPDAPNPRAGPDGFVPVHSEMR